MNEGRVCSIKNQYGKGHAYYLGCMTGQEQLAVVLKDALAEAGLKMQEKASGVIIRKGRNEAGKTIRFLTTPGGNIQKYTVMRKVLIC